MRSPVIDLHCDLLSHLAIPGAECRRKESIGCSIPALQAGNVQVQVMAIFSATEEGSTEFALRQSAIFRELPSRYPEFRHLHSTEPADQGPGDPRAIRIVAAIENASCFCEEEESPEAGFRRLEQIMAETGPILYIGLTHNAANRFGGGNMSAVGLRDDGKRLLEYLSGRRIAIDLSHASDTLVADLFDYMDRQRLDIPVLASHSNFRAIHSHARNLPDELAKEIMLRGGVIGINFLRAFLHDTDAGAMYDHVLHALQLDGEEALSFGADFFCLASHPDPSRQPFFFGEHEDAGCYPGIVEKLVAVAGKEVSEKIAWRNAAKFLAARGMAVDAR
jgi:microsomal dipeptidase-like Zn-dependent dipeptidase